MINLMIDIETLGTIPGSVILAIAAVPFNVPATGVVPFYEKINKDSCIASGLFTQRDTLSWWAKQSVEAYAEAFSGKRELKEVLLELTEYCSQWKNVKVWGNGASFDIPLIEAAYVACGITAPWRYYNSLCYRTLKNLYPQVPFQPPTAKHNALADATAQAEHADRILGFAKITKIGDR